MMHPPQQIFSQTTGKSASEYSTLDNSKKDMPLKLNIVENETEVMEDPLG